MIDQAKAIGIIIDEIKALLGEDLDTSAVITADTTLIGEDALLDSMNLVQLCVNLEDIAADHDFDFDWTSEAAMSKSRSVFRNIGSLAENFAAQQQAAS